MQFEFMFAAAVTAPVVLGGVKVVGKVLENGSGWKYGRPCVKSFHKAASAYERWLAFVAPLNGGVR